MISRTRARIARQSVDREAHVGERRLEVVLQLARAAPASVTRSISYSCQDSACAACAPLAADVDERPRRSRRTCSTGCTIRCTASSARPKAMPRESTRNGMSSVTVSTSVCADSKPSLARIGIEDPHQRAARARGACRRPGARAPPRPAAAARARRGPLPPRRGSRRAGSAACSSCARRCRRRPRRVMRSISATRAAGMLRSSRLSSTATGACMPIILPDTAAVSRRVARVVQYERRRSARAAARDYTCRG